jgi:hypothetical protein
VTFCSPLCLSGLGSSIHAVLPVLLTACCQNLQAALQLLVNTMKDTERIRQQQAGLVQELTRLQVPTCSGCMKTCKNSRIMLTVKACVRRYESTLGTAL